MAHATYYVKKQKYVSLSSRPIRAFKLIRIFHVHEVKIEKVCPSVNCFWRGNEACRSSDKNSSNEGILSLSAPKEHD